MKLGHKLSGFCSGLRDREHPTEVSFSRVRSEYELLHTSGRVQCRIKSSLCHLQEAAEKRWTLAGLTEFKSLAVEP